MHFWAEKDQSVFTWALLRPCPLPKDSPAVSTGPDSLHVQYTQAEGLSQLSKLSLFHITRWLYPADVAFFTCWASIALSAKLRNADQDWCSTRLTWRPQSLHHPWASWFRRTQGGSLFFIPATHSWSHMAKEHPSQPPFYLWLQGEIIQSGIQFCAIQSRTDLSSLSSPYHEHLDRL